MEIEIRPYMAGDANKLHEAVRVSIGHLSPWLPWCSEAYSLDDARFWVDTAPEAWQQGTDYRFGIFAVADGRLLGGVGINQLIEQHKIGNLGYWVRSDATGLGVARRAARQALEYGFNQLRLMRIEVYVLRDNHASRKVAESLGGEYEGLLRNKLYHLGKPQAAHCYGVIPADLNL